MSVIWVECRDQTGAAWMIFSYSVDPTNYTLGLGFPGNLSLGILLFFVQRPYFRSGHEG
jgi:hypothetical protein